MELRKNIIAIVVGIVVGYTISLLTNDSQNLLNEETKKVTSVMKTLSHLEQEYKKLRQQLSQSQHEVISLNREIDGLDESDITNEQLSVLVPEDYKSLVVVFNGKIRDKILNFHSQPEDSEHNNELSNSISSFILNHTYSLGVELNSIICKESYCEILINETERPSWHNIWHDLTKQDWWKSSYEPIFGDTFSSSKTNKDGNIYIYYFLPLKS